MCKHSSISRHHGKSALKSKYSITPQGGRGAENNKAEGNSLRACPGMLLHTEPHPASADRAAGATYQEWVQPRQRGGDPSQRSGLARWISRAWNRCRVSM